uniref:Uncharacterized protein n=1 Tax=Rhizophora mucronata TaxID=61149 RepID=A0A2P2PRS8_RHIMU
MYILLNLLLLQYGPLQLKYMTFLIDSSDCFSFSSLTLFDTIAEDEADKFLAWDTDLTLFLACWFRDLIVLFHLQIPWSFRASTAPMLVAIIQDLLIED